MSACQHWLMLLSRQGCSRQNLHARSWPSKQVSIGTPALATSYHSLWPFQSLRGQQGIAPFCQNRLDIQSHEELFSTYPQRRGFSKSFATLKFATWKFVPVEGILAKQICRGGSNTDMYSHACVPVLLRPFPPQFPYMMSCLDSCWIPERHHHPVHMHSDNSCSTLLIIPYDFEQNLGNCFGPRLCTAWHATLHLTPSRVYLADGLMGMVWAEDIACHAAMSALFPVVCWGLWDQVMHL